MANIDQLYALATTAPYQREGFVAFSNSIRQNLTRALNIADNISVEVYQLANNTVQEIDDAAANLLGVWVESPAGATADAFVQIFNVADTGVTLGTTVADLVFKVPQGTSIGYRLFPGDDARDLFDTALSFCCTTTGTGSTAPAAGDRPIVRFVFNT